MKFVFSHDHKFFLGGDGDFFSSGSFPASVWSRYLKVCDELTVVGRYGGAVEGAQGFVVSSRDNVGFELVPNLATLRSLVVGNRKAGRICRRIVESSDGVIARLPSRVGSLFVREAIKQRKPYAIEVVGDPLEALKNHGSWKGKAYGRLASRSLRNIVKSSPFTIYVTENHLQHLYPAAGITEFCSNVAINPVDRSCLDLRLERIQRCKPRSVLGLIGNFSASYKGIDVVIRALKEIVSVAPDWEFQIVGKGDSSSYVTLAENLGVSDNVKFVGSLPAGDAVFDWLDNVDIYLQPSLTEGLPRALIEAMSRGCPAVASNVGGIPELLPAEQLVSPGDHNKLAERILDLIKDRNNQCRLANQNFEKAKDYYSDVIEERRSRFWSEFRDFVVETQH